MNVDGMDEGTREFEQRTRQLLNDSVERLPAAVRSRLTQARYAALATRPRWQRSLARTWAPAGAAAVLALALIIMPRGENSAVNPLAGATPEDLAILADSDALQLGKEEDVDADFYEWAAGEAQSATASSVGT